MCDVIYSTFQRETISLMKILLNCLIFSMFVLSPWNGSPLQLRCAENKYINLRMLQAFHPSLVTRLEWFSLPWKGYREISLKWCKMWAWRCWLRTECSQGLFGSTCYFAFSACQKTDFSKTRQSKLSSCHRGNFAAESTTLVLTCTYISRLQNGLIFTSKRCGVLRDCQGFFLDY